MKTKLHSILILFFALIAIIPLIAEDSITSEANIQESGVPIIYSNNDTLFYIFSTINRQQPEDRAELIKVRLERIIEKSYFTSDTFAIIEKDTIHDFYFGEHFVMSVTDFDAKSMNLSLKELSSFYITILDELFDREIAKVNIQNILIRIGLIIIIIVFLFFLVKYTFRLFKQLDTKILEYKHRIKKGIAIKDYEFVSTESLLKATLILAKILKYMFISLVLYLSLPVIFSFFPWTKGLAETLFGYILNPVKNVIKSVIDYIPNLFTIIVLLIGAFYTIRFARFIAGEIERGALVIPNFYPDWAKPTFNVVRFLICIFALILIYPYLPSSDSDIFKGVSVFLGLLISIGSSTAISNIVAGLVITYMRPFKVGDRIKIGEITGIVIGKTLLVTRLRTNKNEDITVPNSTVLSGYTVNYSSSSSELGLILHTTITIGYDVPWRKVHSLMIEAALKTNKILQEPKPFVLQTSLDDFYVSYQINAFTNSSLDVAFIYSELHQNIQDLFSAAEIEILSPHYKAFRDGNQTTIPNESFANITPPQEKPNDSKLW